MMLAWKPARVRVTNTETITQADQLRFVNRGLLPSPRGTNRTCR